MGNKKLWLGMLVILLAFGMTVVGCDSEDKEPDPLELIKGTYVRYNSYSIFDIPGSLVPPLNDFKVFVFDGSQRFTEQAGVWDIEDNTQLITETSYQSFIYDGNILRILGTTLEYTFSKDKNILYAHNVEYDRRIEQKETMQAKDVFYSFDPANIYLNEKSFFNNNYTLKFVPDGSSSFNYTLTSKSGDSQTGVISFPGGAVHGTSFRIPALSNDFIPCYFSSDGRRLYVHTLNSVDVYYNW